ncbi:MAG: selenide, water dikinase SelD [bacterium]|nr:selenide, water dikinase SelD [bacterium]
MEEIRLTQMCSCAGCAAKITAANLEKMLKSISFPVDDRVIAGHQSADDAVVVKLTPELALVQTVDFFTPVVDDPFRFGRVAAANSLSDVYAMGGTPFTAMNITCFPTKKLGTDILAQILRGGLEKVLEAGAVMAGGHTIEDDEPKFGLAVTGLINPKNLIAKGGARPGDVLVLTKPLGTGVLNTAHKRGKISPEHLNGVLKSMETLNKAASEALVKLEAKGGTDVTGYSLMGHSLEMCRASHVAMEFDSKAVPLLPGAIEAYENDCIPGGSKANRAYTAEFMEAEADVPDYLIGLFTDAQTSGGLLAALPQEKAEKLLTMIPALFEAPGIIGRVIEPKDSKVLLHVK